MKRLLLTAVIPLTILSFNLITEWWYVDVVDWTDEVLYGFPFPYKCNGWHTSMSTQYFVLAFCFDLLVYFLGSAVLIYFIDRFISKVVIGRWLIISFWSLFAVYATACIYISVIADDRYRLHPDFDYEIRATGPLFIEQRKNMYNPDGG